MQAEPVAPTVSVVVPLHQGARYIDATLDSLLAQTEPLHEVIVVDDGSTDDGPCRARSHPLHPTVIRQDRAGVAVARNRGALHASGTHVCFLDQDDLWMPARHARLQRHLRAHPEHGVVITRAIEVVAAEDVPELRRIGARWHEDRAAVLDGGDIARWCAANRPDDGLAPAIVGTYSAQQLLSGPPSLTTTYVFDRELFLVAGGCDSKTRAFDDYLAVIAAHRLSPTVLLDEPSVAYRVHPRATSHGTDWALPMLVTLAWTKLAGGLTDGAVSTNGRRLAPLVDDRHSWMDKLFQLADRGTVADLLDALAVIQLAGRDRRDRVSAGRMVLKRHLKRRVRWSA